MTDTKLKHLEFIQNVIDRLSQKSFLVKSWSITTITALVAFGINNSNYKIFIIGVPISIIFWCLDGKYLWLERVFINLYNAVINDNVSDMSMDISSFKENTPKRKAFFRPTILLVYLPQIIILIICFVLYSPITCSCN